MEIKRGDKWSRLSYGEITDVNGDSIMIKNEDGKAWTISKDIFEAEFNVAGSTSNGVVGNITQTALIDLVLSKPGTIMTVNFNKKIDEKEVAAEISKFDTTHHLSATGLAKKILQGEERTIIGRHYHGIDEMGRLQFIDMELPKELKTSRDGTCTYDTRLRKVDPRTINWVIVENVKYIVK